MARELPLIQEEGPAYRQTLCRRFLSCHPLVLFFLDFSFEAKGHKQELEKLADNSNDSTGALTNNEDSTQRKGTRLLRRLFISTCQLLLENTIGEADLVGVGSLSPIDQLSLELYATTHIPNKSTFHQHHSLLSEVNILIDDNGSAKVADFDMSYYEQNGRKLQVLLIIRQTHS